MNLLHLIGSLLTGITIILTGFLWIGYTTQGTHWALKQITTAVDIPVEHIQGQLLETVTLENIHYPDFSIQALSVRWLPEGYLQISQFTVEIPSLGTWKLRNNVLLSIAPESITLETPLCWKSDTKNICVNGSWTKQLGLAVDINLRSIPIMQLIQPRPPWLSGIHNIRGNIRADAHISGSLITPQITGSAQLTQGNADIPEAGLRLKNIQLQLKISETGYAQLLGQGQSGSGILKLSGKGSLIDMDDPVRFELTGNQVELFNTPEYKIIASPQLQAHLLHNKLSIRGSIFIPKALVKPGNFSSQSIVLSDDVVFIDPEDTTTSAPLAWDAQILLTLGDHIDIDLFGLQGRLSGRLMLTDQSNSLATGKGEIHLVGNYKAYGQALKIRRGRLMFNGGPLNNPALNIQATKEVTLSQASPQLNFQSGLQPGLIQRASTPMMQGNKATIGVSVGGSLNKHQVTLFSEPVLLSQSDILSYLILGRPASQAGRADAQLLFRAASALDAGSDPVSSLKTQLEDTLGLSELNIGSTTKELTPLQGSRQYTALILGKALSPRLYLNYSVGLFQAVQTLKLSYLLTRRFTLQTETNRIGNAVDVFYTIESNDSK